MKKLMSDFKKGIVKIKVENLDDLWYLSQIVDEGDLISGKTERKVKLGGEGDRAGKNVRKVVFLEIKAEKVEFIDNVLRINGKVTIGTDDVPAASYHTFNIDLTQHTFTLKKEKWLTYQRTKLNDALNSVASKIIILVLDREKAIFAQSTTSDYKILAELQGSVNKKSEENQAKGSFYSDVEKVLKDYILKYKPNHVILGSPAFFKEDFLKTIKSKELKKIITFATCSSVTSNAINEILKRPEINHILKQDMIAKETKLVAKLMQEISKDNLAVYGIRETKKAADSGAIQILLVTDSKIKKSREQKTFAKLDSVMRLVDDIKGEVHLISSTHEAGKQLDGLGGIAGILRYKLL